jgi:hypothetical protein
MWNPREGRALRLVTYVVGFALGLAGAMNLGFGHAVLGAVLLVAGVATSAWSWSLRRRATRASRNASVLGS